MAQEFIVDSEVMSVWSERCSAYSRNTLWLLPMSLLSTVGPIVVVALYGASYFIAAFSFFGVALFIIGLILTIKAPQLFCPHCSRRPLRALRLDRRYMSPLTADYCERCHYWLRESSAPGAGT
jgi:hypothetical protein